MADADWGGATYALQNTSINDSGFTPDFASSTAAAAAAEHESGFAAESISKHDDGGCRICNAQGHFARDCPEKPEGGNNTDGCFRCGQQGHQKADCPERPANDGACFRCGEVGHNKADCPMPAPASKCKICSGEEHSTEDCTVNRLFQANGIDSSTPVDAKSAWETLVQADDDKDLDNIKHALLLYVKACNQSDQGEIATLVGMEQTFRGNDMNTYLIAIQKELAVTHTIVNLQGEPGQQYVATLQFSAKPRRKKQDDGWPDSAEDNLTRLQSAGFVMDSFAIVCRNCGEVGHTRSRCEQEKTTETITVECSVCNEQGHRARDCTAPRRKPGGDKECRNCGEVGHISKDCPSKEARTCNNCGSAEHMAKECDQPRNEATVTCRNCDEKGHFSKNCPKPTDWSRVTCSNCNEKGHTYKRCKAPPAAEAGGDGDGGWGDNAPVPAAANDGGW